MRNKTEAPTNPSQSSAIRVVVLGAGGRMSRAVIRLLEQPDSGTALSATTGGATESGPEEKKSTKPSKNTQNTQNTNNIDRAQPNRTSDRAGMTMNTKHAGTSVEYVKIDATNSLQSHAFHIVGGIEQDLPDFLNSPISSQSATSQSSSSLKKTSPSSSSPRLSDSPSSSDVPGSPALLEAEHLFRTLGDLEAFTRSATCKTPLATSFQELANFYKEPAFVDVVIDFSHPQATLHHLKQSAQYGNPAWVIGTTGFSPAEEQTLKHASHKRVIVRSGNFSKGIHALIPLLRQAILLLGPDYDIEITETHHRHKKDAPSGTAKMLARALTDAKALIYDNHVRMGRSGANALRQPNEIGISAIRGGGVIGEHTIHFIGQEETLSFTHSAISRQAFASGVPAALTFAHYQHLAHAHAFYQMHDVIEWLKHR